MRKLTRSREFSNPEVAYIMYLILVDFCFGVTFKASKNKYVVSWRNWNESKAVHSANRSDYERL